MSDFTEQPAVADKLETPSGSATLAAAVARAMERAVRRAIAEHHRAGDPVAIWRDGRVMLLYPDGTLQETDGDTAQSKEQG
jgi:hypothetical protein